MTHPSSLVQGQDGHLLSPVFIEHLGVHTMVQSPPSHQNLLYIELPKQKRKENLLNHYGNSKETECVWTQQHKHHQHLLLLTIL